MREFSVKFLIELFRLLFYPCFKSNCFNLPLLPIFLLDFYRFFFHLLNSISYFYSVSRVNLLSDNISISNFCAKFHKYYHFFILLILNELMKSLISLHHSNIQKSECYPKNWILEPLNSSSIMQRKTSPDIRVFCFFIYSAGECCILEGQPH